MENFISCVITAGGSGRRTGHQIPKQFILLEGRRVIERTLDVFSSLEEISEIILVIREEDEEIYESICKKYDQEIKLAIGGKTREESTFNGLQKVSKKADFILTHDGARPFVKKELVLSLIEEGKRYPAVILGTPAIDTIKILDEEHFVEKTPDRSTLYHIQTPQIFEKDLLLKAYEKAFKEKDFTGITDDSSIVEKFGERIKVLEGDIRNFKITTDFDLLIAKKVLQRRKNV